MAGEDATGLSPADLKTLARLVGKYGWNAIASAAKRVRPNRVGHPRNYEKRSETWEHVEWIELRADELGRGHGAVNQAVAERFMKVTPRDKWNDAAELAKFAKRVKNRRDEWSRLERIHAARPRSVRIRRRRRPA